MAKDPVCGENLVLKYLLPYKTSQDHLELFFGAVRAAGGWNNNPTAIQFRSAYNQLLMRHNITAGKGNCVPQDDTEMPSNVEDQSDAESSSIKIEDVIIARKYDLALKCICNENFDFGIFTSSENFIFSDHFDTNLVAKFELEVCEFLV